MESVANFTSRATEIGMAEDLLTELKGKGIDTFNKLAYIAAVSPNSGDDTKLKQALDTLLAPRVLTAIEMICMRQLWFESYTFAMTELEERFKKSPGDTPKAMPMAERLVRLDKQKKKLTGLIFDQYLEPAHGLTDKAMAMIEDGVLTYLAPEKCASRHDEIQNQKSDQVIQFDSQGGLKVAKKATDMNCDVSGELKLRQALTRRSLAMEQAGLCSFTKLESWHTQMMNTTMREPPNGHKYVSMQQVLNADKELWALMSQETRGQLKVAVGQDPPLDKHLDDLTKSPQVLCFMTPLPGGRLVENSGKTSDSTSSKQPPKPDRAVASQGNGKKRNFDQISKPSGSGTVKELLKSMPQNCVSKLDSGKFICLHYNNGTCKRQKNSSCNMGAHVCYYKGCHKKRPYIECSH